MEISTMTTEVAVQTLLGKPGIPRKRKEWRALRSKRGQACRRIIKEGVGIELHATKGYRRGTRYGKKKEA